MIRNFINLFRKAPKFKDRILVDKVKERLELIFGIDKSNLILPVQLEGRVRTVFLPLEFCRYSPFEIALHFAKTFPKDLRYLDIKEDGGNRIGYLLYVASSEYTDDVICEVSL